MTDSYPVLDAFLCILKMKGVQSSRAAFLTGIPVQKAPSLQECLRATQKKGLKTKLCTCPLNEVTAASVPLILILKEASSPVAILESFSAEKDQYTVIFFSDSNERLTKVLSKQALSALYSGEAIFISKPFKSPEREAGAMPSFSKWLLNECFAMRSVYRDVLLASVFLNLFVLASPLFVMNVYDRVVPNQAIETLWVLAIGVGLVFIFDLIIKLLRHYYIELAGKRLDVTLSARLFETVLSLRAEVFPASVGEFASKIKDFDSIKQFFTAATFTALVDLPFALLFLWVIYYVGGAVAWAPVAAAVVMLLYGFLVHFPLKSVVEKSQRAAAQKNAVLVETLAGIETLKVFNAEGRQQAFWEDCLIYLAKTGVSARRLADSISIVSGFIMQVTMVAVVVIGVYQINAHQMSMGALIACVLLSSRALAPMAQLAGLSAQYYQAKSALKALDELTQLPVEHSENQAYLTRSSFAGDIAIQNLNFTYDHKEMILQNLNVKIDAGEKVAIIGKIGSGKSTLMRLLLGLGKATSGQIKIDHIDIDQLDPAELRNGIGYVPQDITLFRGSLKENILLKAPFSDNDALLAAAEIGGLREFVNGHSKGFDLPVGEQGKGLSGGQRQSIAIARAVLGNPQILLFDELTSAMDNQTESAVIEKIQAFSEGKTMLLSTHRASLLSLVDRVIVMDAGRIIADGPKEKVLDALKRGLIHAGSQNSSVSQV